MFNDTLQPVAAAVVSFFYSLSPMHPTQRTANDQPRRIVISERLSLNLRTEKHVRLDLLFSNPR